MAGNLQRSKAWIPPWVSPHTPLFPLSRAHFRPALSFHHGQKLRWPEEDGAGSSRDPGDTTSVREPGGSWGLALLPTPPPGHSSGPGRLQGLHKVFITLWPPSPTHPAGGGFPTIQFAGSRAPPAPRSPMLASSPCPKMKMSVCACLWGHIGRACVSLCMRLPGGALGFICCTFLEASCRPGSGWGNAGDSSCPQTGRQKGRGRGKAGWVVVKEASSSGRRSRQTQAWAPGARSIHPSASAPAWTTAVTSFWLSPSFLLSPSNPRCLPQPEQCFQTVNQITSLPTPLLPQLPIICRREAKPCPQQGPGLPSGGAGKDGPLASLQAHLPPSPCPPPPPGSIHTSLFTVS